MSKKPKMKMMSEDKEKEEKDKPPKRREEDRNAGSGRIIDSPIEEIVDWQEANNEAIGMSKDKFGYKEWLQHKQRM